MSDNNKLTFNVEKYSLDDANNENYSKLRLWIVSNGQNKHKMPISLDAIKDSAFSLIGKPILYKYSDVTHDFKDHDISEVPCGTFLENCNAHYEEDTENSEKSWLVADAIVWNYYCPEVIKVFQRDENKAISMEIEILETVKNPDNEDEITKFVFLGVTLLGKKYSPAIENAKATIIKFEELKDAAEKVFMCFIDPDDIGQSGAITIDNSKKSAVNGAWNNPGKKLYDPILKASNNKSLINEAYLISEEGYEENPSSKLKYPHHVIKTGKLVLHIRGVEAAFQRAKAQGLTGEPISHIRKHYKELGLDQENFVLFGLTIEEFEFLEKEEKNLAFNKEEFAMQVGMTAMDILSKMNASCGDKYSVRDYCGKYVYAYEYESGSLCAIPYSVDGKEITMETDKVCSCRTTYVVDDTENTDDFAAFTKAIIDEKELKVAEKDKELNEQKEKFTFLDAEKNDLVKEVETLKEFKVAAEKHEKDMKVEIAFNEVKETLNEKQIEEWKAKVDEYENIDAFSNALKAFAFTQTKNKVVEETTRMSLPNVNTNDTKGLNVWQRIKNSL